MRKLSAPREYQYASTPPDHVGDGRCDALTDDGDGVACAAGVAVGIATARAIQMRCKRLYTCVNEAYPRSARVQMPPWSHAGRRIAGAERARQVPDPIPRAPEPSCRR